MLEYKETVKRYSNTLALIYDKKRKERVAVQFSRMGEDRRGEFKAMGFGVYESDYLKTDKGEDLKTTDFELAFKDFEILSHPTKKVFNWGNRSFVFSRVPNRQWHRGLSGQNFQLDDIINSMFNNVLMDRVIAMPKFRSYHIGVDIIASLFFNRPSQSLQEALRYIEKEGFFSKNIDDMYILSSTLFPDKPYLLYRYTLPVAFVYPDKKLLTVTDNLYQQEVIDFCIRKGLDYNVN